MKEATQATLEKLLRERYKGLEVFIGGEIKAEGVSVFRVRVVKEPDLYRDSTPMGGVLWAVQGDRVAESIASLFALVDANLPSKCPACGMYKGERL